LIDIGGLAELRGIEVSGDSVQIGALTRHVEVERSPIITSKAPLLSAAMPHVAHAAIRNRGTIGGSLALADPAAELPACMLALEATLVIASTQGERQVPAKDFFKGLYTTALEPDEILTRIDVPARAVGWRYHFNEFARRHGDYALVGIAAACGPVEKGSADLRLVYFGCGERPLRAKHVESVALKSGFSSPTLDKDVVAAIGHDLDPQSDLHASSATRLHLATVLACRAARYFSHT
jgi:carbon-monoxide dehydrogenase medium subunit